MANHLGGSRKVAYYHGCFANYYYPEIGKELIRVLEHNGIQVTVPEQKCCGLPMLANGNYKGARKNALYNIKSLNEAVEKGYDIVATCSSCSLMLKRDYPEFFGGEEAKAISQHLYNINEYLLKLYKENNLDTKFKEIPMRVLYHCPCHLRAQGIVDETVSLLKLIPGLSVVRVSTYCCGMGGSYAMKVANYDLSLEIGNKVFTEVKEAKVDRAVTECGGCKLQIEAGTGVEAIHPIVLIGEAYTNPLG